jgi:phosphoserine phosphatase
MMIAMAQQERIALEQVVAIGDGANDLDMLAAAGLGVAFCAKRVVRQAADTTLSIPHLDAILFLLGVRSEELELEVDS